MIRFYFAYYCNAYLMISEDSTICLIIIMKHTRHAGYSISPRDTQEDSKYQGSRL